MLKVVEAWDSITKLIVERENWMAKLEAFERNASDPNRFFEKGFYPFLFNELGDKILKKAKYLQLRT